MKAGFIFAIACAISLAACTNDDQVAPAAQKAAPAAYVAPKPVSVYEKAEAAAQVKAFEAAVRRVASLPLPSGDPRAARDTPVDAKAMEAFQVHERALDDLAKVAGPGAKGWARHEVSKKILQKDEIRAYRMNVSRMRHAERQQRREQGPASRQTGSPQKP